MLISELVATGKILLDADDANMYGSYVGRIYTKEAGYAQCYAYDPLAAIRVDWQLGRLLLGVIDNHIFVDHKNRNTLDNRRENLRVVTPSQSAQNRRCRVDNSSGYKGVKFLPQSGRWGARITTKLSRKRLGVYLTAEAAARAYDEAALQYHGEFAALNFPVRSDL